ncbi:MAG TPA: hypothetical protein VEY70_21370 [Metabacillus sp.]|nr:hypothetical protein [Metabacillus sp.]
MMRLTRSFIGDEKMMLFNEYTHKQLYEFFLYELEIELTERYDNVNENDEMLEPTTQSK